ncbi:MAG: nitrite/sulfite reductase [Burkholderiaceae bacterium]
MYTYDSVDQALVDARVAQFRDQTARYLAGELGEEAFKPLRLQNGLYIQRHAPMLRIAIPYGVLSSRQLRTLADIADEFDAGYGHFSTRQNLQLNGPQLARVPDILARLATVQMHAIQTSGNCVRNVTVDHLAGVAEDELVDPRPVAELIRQWANLHAEFAFLPRKFKIAVSGAREDRAAIRVHDIGLVVHHVDGDPRIDVWVGGGLGRTPIIAEPIRRDLEPTDLLDYLEAILRVYNRHGRRDNLYKARIKILVRSLGAAAFAGEVEREWLSLRADGSGPGRVPSETLDALRQAFAPPRYPVLGPVQIAGHEAVLVSRAAGDRAFARWLSRSRLAHRQPGRAAVTISLKNGRLPPGDCTSEQMRAVAAMADDFGFGEIRVSHHQNLVLPDVALTDLPDLYHRLREAGLASPNAGLLTDIIACPGGDFCQLANARSIPIAIGVQASFADLDELLEIGEVSLNISGCMNSCGHHHVADIGVLGVDKHGESFYQISIGGRPDGAARIGRILGPAFAEADIVDAIERLVRTYLHQRRDRGERFGHWVERVGLDALKEAVYAELD